MTGVSLEVVRVTVPDEAVAAYEAALAAACGQMIAVQRQAYLRAGGHAAVSRTMHDGIMLPRAFRAAGIMTGIFDASRFSSCRMYADRASLIEGLLKNATEGMAKPVVLPVWTVLLGFGQVLVSSTFTTMARSLAARCSTR